MKPLTQVSTRRLNVGKKRDVIAVELPILVKKVDTGVPGDRSQMDGSVG
jgi:hypothetical protein